MNADWHEVLLRLRAYGVLVLLDGEGKTKEWDIGERSWIARRLSLADWIEEILREGETVFKELAE